MKKLKVELPPRDKPVRFRPGDPVIVRPFAEIQATLDAKGALDGLPFLPEMLKFCGRTFAIRRRVNKLIQEGVGSSMRRIENVVLLEGTICDGRAHRDCQRACFPLWKTDWLKNPDRSSTGSEGREISGDRPTRPESEPAVPVPPPNSLGSEGGGAFSSVNGCQVTELIKATHPLPFWHPLRHYWDFTSRTYTLKEYFTYILGGLYRKSLKRIINKPAKKRSLQPDFAINESPGLKQGDLVEVRSAKDIRATLDSDGKSRGLFFMPGMWAYCGRRLRVLQPVERMMSEKTGEIRDLRQVVILEGVTCDGKAHGGCQRGCYVFWKARWLKRVDGN